ncbi:MATE family efflux transporter [Terriglobus albidus]|uniref:polysaccharide biosynthesis C-terminal domain-containing protein n=1 Tax=Terriglobus albidus TaxID=1592106 RepID=UPI0021DFC583|nr:polysaccharide biosynthesis C-terminal domain-containing protein [Terriglobus albidus]
MTSRREKFLIVKNAIANLVRGGASALVAVLLPSFLTRSMSTEAFGAWSLVLQLSAYVSYLDFGIQTAIARFVAHSSERGEGEYRDRIVSTAMACLASSACIGLLGLVLLSFFIPRLFPHLHGELLLSVRASVILVGGSLCIGLPASVFTGTFVGLQRNEVPAAIIGISRLLSAVLLVVVVRHRGTIPHMALVMALVNVGSYAVQYVAYRRLSESIAPPIRLSLSKISKAAATELFDYCFSLTVWGLGILLVTGLDLTIVGIYSFGEVAYYSIAATVVTLLAGSFGAIFGAMGSTTAVIHARGDRAGLGKMVLGATRMGTVMLLATGLPLIVFAHPLLRVWVDAQYAANGAILLQVLVAANIIRMTVTPYVLAMIGSGEQRRVILTPLLEGVSNLLFSVLLARSFGAIGVAAGTMVGSLVGLGGNLFYNMRRTTEIQMSISEYFFSSLLRPSLCFLPIGLAAAVWRFLPMDLIAVRFICGVLATAISLGMLWRFALQPEERTKLVATIRGRLGREIAPS